MMNGDRRPPIYLLTGLIVGLALGVVYAWMLAPAENIGTEPITLREDFKDDYRALIAAAYIASGDLGRAEARLALLGDEDPARELAVQAQLTLGEGGSQDTARALGILAAHLAGDLESIEIAGGPTRESPAATTAPGIPTEVQAPTATSQPDQPEEVLEETPLASEAPTLAPTSQPTAAPTATQGAPFALIDIELVCDPINPLPLVQVYVFDAANNQVPGVKALVTWDGGQDSFFTGFKPEFGLGYADFEMTPGVSYTLRLTDGGDPVTALVARECPGEDGGRFWGTWRLNFAQP